MPAQQKTEPARHRACPSDVHGGQPPPRARLKRSHATAIGTIAIFGLIASFSANHPSTLSCLEMPRKAIMLAANHCTIQGSVSAQAALTFSTRLAFHELFCAKKMAP
jgi:hypothetical protein